MAATAASSTRLALDRDLAALQTDLLRMGDNVDRAIERASDALTYHESSLARGVIEHDRHINAQRYRIENAGVALIATQQPTAGDLRRVIVAMHVAGELERMADHASGIADLALQLSAPPTLSAALKDIRRMSEATRRMLRAALNAFILVNVEQARRTIELDDLIDNYHQQIVRTLLTYMMEDRSVISQATYLMWVAHNLERIGDRCTNLGERTLSLVNGQVA